LMNLMKILSTSCYFFPAGGKFSITQISDF